jgi:hypothetical protein
MALTQKQKWYVYELVCPITFKTFYVGKGTGDRVYSHVKEVKRNSKSMSNQAKIDKIRYILSQGKEVIELIIEYFDNQEDAIDYEADLIVSYGVENLTNINSRGAISVKPLSNGEDKSSMRLMISMLARFSNPHYCASRVYTSSDFYIDALWRFNKIVEMYNQFVNGVNRAVFMDMLNKEIDRRYTGRCLKVMY